MKTIDQKFFPYVQKTEECWIWSGSRFESGYGRLFVGGKSVRAHRVSWVLNRGPIPKGILVLHKCDNRPCVNPDHLFLGTPQDNMDDMMAKGRGISGMKIHPERACRGEMAHRAKLTASKVVEIRALREQGVIYEKIAKKYGVTKRAIICVVKRLSWKHIK